MLQHAAGFSRGEGAESLCSGIEAKTRLQAPSETEAWAPGPDCPCRISCDCVRLGNMKPTVYIETSVISYLTSRPSRDLVTAAHQQITHDWWARVLPRLNPFVSVVVLDEIAQGDRKASQRRIETVALFGVLQLAPEVRDLADRYFEAMDLPAKARADAYHLAMATYHGMDYLLTWNCTHIAGARARRVVERVNSSLNIASPAICTPEELMEV